VDITSLDDAIETLGQYGDSILLAKCLLLSGQEAAASKVCERVAQREVQRLNELVTNRLYVRADSYVRIIFAFSLAGRKRNAIIYARQMLNECRGHDDRAEGITTSLVAAAMITEDAGICRGILESPAIRNTPAELLVYAYLVQDYTSLGDCSRELTARISQSEIPLWSDTWHHIVSYLIEKALLRNLH